MDEHFFQALPLWQELASSLSDGRSLILQAAREYGVHDCLRAAWRGVSVTSDKHVALSSSPSLQTSSVDYPRLWKATKSQLRTSVKADVNNAGEFEDALERTLRWCGGRVVVSLTGARRGNERNHWELLALFDRLLRHNQNKGTLQVVAIDDYSTISYVSRLTDGSHFDFYHFREFAALSSKSIETCVSRVAVCRNWKIGGQRESRLAKALGACTGGHPGMLRDLFAVLEKTGVESKVAALTELFMQELRASPILITVAEALLESPLLYCKTALEFDKPEGVYSSSHDPTVEYLQQLGVLHHTSPGRLQLCPGAIAAMARDMYGRLPKPVPPSARALPTSRAISDEGTGLALTNDDFVIVHLSDLHAGEKYRFRYLRPGKPDVNESNPFLSQLLRDDLDSLGLLGRIDALIFTGDFSEKGDKDDFILAHKVLSAVLADIGVEAARTLLIPGNHDVHWNRAPTDPPGAGMDVDRTNYNNFLKLWPRDPGREAEILPLDSRSGKGRLRIIGLDSNKVEGPGAPGVGYVSQDAFRLAEHYLDADPSREGVQGTTWVAVHHHVFPATSIDLPKARRNNVTLLANSWELQSRAMKWGAELVLHGHEHQPSMTAAERCLEEDHEPSRRLITIGAGSVGAAPSELGPFSRNHYYVIYRRSNDLVIRSRCLADGGVTFTRHRDRVLPLAK